MNALDPTVAEFRERLKHQRREKRRRLNAMIDGPRRLKRGVFRSVVDLQVASVGEPPGASNEIVFGGGGDRSATL